MDGNFAADNRRRSVNSNDKKDEFTQITTKVNNMTARGILIIVSSIKMY